MKHSGSGETIDNPTRAFIAKAIQTCAREVSLDINPALASLRTVLVEAQVANVTLRFSADENTVQGNGVVSGGTLANYLDSSTAMAVLSALKAGQTCSTVCLNVNMLRSAKAGEIIAKAKVDKLGKRIAFASATLFDLDGTIIAMATSSLAVN